MRRTKTEIQQGMWKRRVFTGESGKLTSGTATVKDLLAGHLDHGKASGRQETTVREYRRIAEKTEPMA